MKRIQMALEEDLLREVDKTVKQSEVPRRLRSSFEHPKKGGLVQELDPELPGPLQLAPGLLAGDDVIGLLAHGRGHAPAAALDRFLGLVARERS